MKKFIGNYAAFNEWANHRIVGWLKTLDQELLYTQTPSSYSSIDYTLQHILRTQRFWIRFIGSKDLSDFNWAVREREVENILNELISVSTQMKEEFSAFSESELQEVLHFDRPWAKNDLCRYEYIVHIINHGTFHRGQIVTMARCLGITEGIVNTDYNMFNTPFPVH
ncbi:MAG: DinB family protein [Saprospiraceae bacterium]|nr:DinB family protein [Candidatus Opimibacter iunctus]